MSKFRVCVHRWITGILASAMVFTALPVNVFAEEVEVIEDDVLVELEGEGESEENVAVTFDTTGISSITYKVGESEESQTWNAGEGSVSVTKNSAVTITGVTASNGYDSDSVTVKLGETAVVKSDAGWAVGSITADTTVSVIASLKVGVTVTTLVNAEAPAAATATVEITGLDSENKTKGEALVLTVTPAEDKIVTSATYMIGTSTPADLTVTDSKYVVPAEAVLTAMEQGNNISIAIVVANKDCDVSFATTGISEIKYTIGDGDEQTWSLYDEYPSVPYGQAFVITGITVMDGYKADTLTVKDGETTITKSEDNKWTVGAIISDKTITMSADLKPGVTVTTLVNGQAPSAATATVDIYGLGTDSKTKDTAVNIQVYPAAGMDIDEVSYQIGTGTPVILKRYGINEFIIPVDAVLTAMDQGNGISVAITVINPDEQVYETKLGLNKKTTSFIAGEGVVDIAKININDPETYKDTILLATAKFNTKTTVKKLSHAEVIDPYGYTSLTSNWGLLLVGDEIRMYQSNYLWEPGKYTLKVYPASPDGRSVKPEPATLTLTVKRRIEDIEVKNVPSKVYKASDKAVTLKPTVTYNYGEKSYEPAVKKVTWELLDKDHNPLPSGKITIKNGTVTVAKDYAVSTTPENNRFYIKAKAADYIGNSAYGETLVEIVGTRTEIKSIVIGSVSDFSDAVFSGDLLRKEIVVKDANGNKIDPENITITSSDPKNFSIGAYSYYDEVTGDDIDLKYAVKKIEKAGKFTVSVTVNDGTKTTFKQVVKVKEATPASYHVAAFAYHDYNNYSNRSEQITFDESKTASLNKFPTYIYVVSEASSSDSSVLSNNATLTVKGGKKLSSGTNKKGKRWVSVKPNSDKITITHKYGKGSCATNETYTINLAHSNIKVAATKKAYDIWADVDDQDFEFDFNVSGIEDTTAGNYCLKYNFPDSFPSKSENIYRSLINSLNSADPVSLTKDSSKFTVSGNLWNYTGFPKGTYKLNAALYKATETEDGTVYSAVSDSFEVTFKASKAKAPSVAIDVSDRKPLEVEKESGKTALIGFKTFKNVRKENDKEKAIITSSIKVYCNNKDGSVNKFTEFFNVIPVVKNGDNYDQSTGYYADGIQLVVKSTEGINEPKDLTGWVEYTVVGEDGYQTVKKTEKITVKFK